MAQGVSGAARVTENLIPRVDFDIFECGFLTDAVSIHILSDPPTSRMSDVLNTAVTN